jgi:hypothetical protein
MGRTKKVEEVEVVEEVVVDDSMPVTTTKTSKVQESEASKSPDINNPEEGNKTYADMNS